MIAKQSDIKVLSLKDYMKNPKPSGYQSYHMLVPVPIFLSDTVVDTKVEIQIRTVSAQDFWASLEHKIAYKFEGMAPAYISHELRECARIVTNLDERMLQLNNAILVLEARTVFRKRGLEIRSAPAFTPGHYYEKIYYLQCFSLQRALSEL